MYKGLLAVDGDSEADTIEMSVFHIQPFPVSIIVVENNGITAIARLWADGDHKRCRLCSSCHARDDGMCLVTTPSKVADEDVELYSLRGFREEGMCRPGLSTAGAY